MAVGCWAPPSWLVGTGRGSTLELVVSLTLPRGQEWGFAAFGRTRRVDSSLPSLLDGLRRLTWG